MKKFTLFVATLFVALTAGAYTLNNPIGADGRYIVKYDVQNKAFFAANTIEVDETFVLAVDVKGTWLEEFLKGTPTAEGASRGVAFNNWTNYGDTHADFRRLKQIDGTIWGFTCNYAQLMVNEQEAPKALMPDSVTYVYGQLFGFEFTDDNPGAGWWMWDGNAEGTSQADGADCLFAFEPYSGAKHCDDLFSDDYEDGDIYGFSVRGYAAPVALPYWVYVKDNTGWESTYLYAWNDGENLQQLGTWPGSLPNGVKNDGTKVWNLKATEGQFHLIFNNNAGTQLENFEALYVTANADLYYTISADNVESGITSGVENLTVDGNVVATEYYTILGAKVAQPTEGLFIKTSVLSNGKRVSEKVYVR